MDTLEKARIHYYHQHCLHKDEPAQQVGWTSREEVDHIVASGALSYHTTDLLFHYSAIVKLFSRVKRSLSFNLLDAGATDPSPWLKAYDKHEVLTFCKRLTTNTALITGYEDDDFTIVMNK